MKMPGRNEPCPCNSGRKYKHCCYAKDRARAAQSRDETATVREVLQQAVQFHRAGHLPEAEARYQQVLQINPDLSRPDLAGVHYNLGNVLREQGRLQDAVASYRAALGIQPQAVEISGNLGAALSDLGRLDEAAGVYLSALASRPGDALLHFNLGNVLSGQGKLDEAVSSYTKALGLKPDWADVHHNLGNALRDLGRLDEALASYRRAVEIQPDFGDARSGVALALADQGKPDEALAAFRAAQAAKPASGKAYSELLAFAGYRAMLAPADYLALARGWERAVVPEAERGAAHGRVFRAAPLSGRRLRLGYVSGDFRQHAVSYFIEQVFRNHDPARIELFAYATHPTSDAATARLRSHAHHWRQAAGMSDAAFREGVAADGIDVLVNLSGHTLHNRIDVFALRAAPVQVEYLGGVGSSGLTEMDYWLGDAIVTPPETDAHYSEQVWRLPRIWVSYEGRAEAPAPGWRAAPDGTVWLGSFNHLSKLTPATFALWARVLHALPEGRLLLKTKQLADAGNRQRVLDVFSAHGIALDRIELQDAAITPLWAGHMAYYDRLDISLDPVGAVGGGTTTCDALWMGVPVVTLAGDRTVSRMTTSMLQALGHPEWAATTEADYVAITVALARDVALRTRLRAAQRDKMAGSALCDARGLTRCLEEAYFRMVERRQGGGNGTEGAVS